MVGGEDLLRVYIGPKTTSMINKAGKFSPSLEKTLQGMAEKAIKKCAIAGLSAYMSKVPIDTQEFRGKVRNQGFLKYRLSSMECHVFVQEGIHLGRDKKKKDSLELSKVLNTGEAGFRSRDSRVVNLPSFKFTQKFEGESTANWIEDAYDDFKTGLPKYLSTLRII